MCPVILWKKGHKMVVVLSYYAVYIIYDVSTLCLKKCDYIFDDKLLN